MWKLMMGAVAAALVVGVAGAGAGHEESAVKSYTGCLEPSGGVIYFVKEGATPVRSCVPLSSRIHLGGGDITAVRVGPGLTGGSENGVATIGLGAGFGLPQGCVNGAVPKWQGTSWACGADNDTTYSAGADLDLVGTTFSVKPGSFARANRSCAAGQFARGVDANGDPTCAAQAGGRAFHAESPGATLDDFVATEVVSLTVPAGSYVISGKVNLTNVDGDPQDASCTLSTGDATGARIGGFPDDHRQAIALLDAATFGGTTRVFITCRTFDGAAFQVVLTAISVGGIN